MHVSVVPLHAFTLEEHLHTLFVASQNDPEALPTQVSVVPHLQDPEVQVSLGLLHILFVPHLHAPLVHVSDVPLHASTLEEHLHTLFVASQ